MRESFTVLIPKKTKKGPIAETTDFRPISLLCCDYKILAKILARRLDIGLRKFIGPHQSYGIRGRSIARNLHVMRTVCEATAEGHQPLAVMQLDLRQAFDRVSHKFLLAALDHFGVGERLREWIALCYREIGTRLLINGVKGARIPIGRSVRQGCPLSPILFALQLEPLCRAISEDQSISGLQLGDGKDVSVLAFADDVAIICSSKKQVEAVLQHVDVYTAASGAEINQEKSMGAWLGPPPVLDGAARLFRFVRRLPAPTATKDFFVRMHMEVLPVKSWLHGKGVFVPWSLNCDLCGNTETIQHVLVECSNAYLFWDEMRTCFRLSRMALTRLLGPSPTFDALMEHEPRPNTDAALVPNLRPQSIWL
ncbi:hypothetical protein ISCGN_002339 [Ixodes scapularis]